MIISPTWKGWTANIIDKNKQGKVANISTVNPQVVKENVGQNKVATYIPISTIFPTSIPKVSTTSIMQVMNGHLITQGNNLYKTYAQPPQQQSKKGFSKTTLLIIVALIGIVALYFIMK
jgi:Tfp pilus assembly protein FimT